MANDIHSVFIPEFRLQYLIFIIESNTHKLLKLKISKNDLNLKQLYLRN